MPGIWGNTGQKTRSENAMGFDWKMDNCKPSGGRLKSISGSSYNQSTYSITDGNTEMLMYKWD